MGDQLIFLDLLRSRYIGVGGAQSAALSAALLGGPTVDEAPTVLVDPALLDEWTRRLRQQHLLCDALSTGPGPTPPGLLEPTASLTADEEHAAVVSDWRHLARLWRASVVTEAWLRQRSLADIANRVTALRARHTQAAADTPAAALAFAAAAYIRLRPFALTTHDRCLHDSLALIHFLATQGLFAHWVIGVRLRPFGAHSWVQSVNVVLNDEPEHVRAYRPILVV